MENIQCCKKNKYEKQSYKCRDICFWTCIIGKQADIFTFIILWGLIETGILFLFLCQGARLTMVGITWDCTFQLNLRCHNPINMKQGK